MTDPRHQAGAYIHLDGELYQVDAYEPRKHNPTLWATNARTEAQVCLNQLEHERSELVKSAPAQLPVSAMAKENTPA